jgi:Protein of unknown function (DUF2887)
MIAFSFSFWDNSTYHPLMCANTCRSEKERDHAMESDSFFYQLFKELPQTLFDLLGLPATQAESYRFDSVEL